MNEDDRADERGAHDDPALERAGVRAAHVSQRRDEVVDEKAAEDAPTSDDDVVEKASEDSYPGSDPPAPQMTKKTEDEPGA